MRVHPDEAKYSLAQMHGQHITYSIELSKHYASVALDNLRNLCRYSHAAAWHMAYALKLSVFYCKHPGSKQIVAAQWINAERHTRIQLICAGCHKIIQDKTLTESETYRNNLQ